MSRRVVTLDAAVYRVGRRPRNTPFKRRYATAANPSSSTSQCACERAAKVPRIHRPLPSNSKLDAESTTHRLLLVPFPFRIGAETSAVFRAAKGDDAPVIHSTVLTPRRGNNNIAQGRADAAVTPASAPPWVREQTKGRALKGRNRHTHATAGLPHRVPSAVAVRSGRGRETRVQREDVHSTGPLSPEACRG